jgi:hypothetical protein
MSDGYRLLIAKDLGFAAPVFQNWGVIIEESRIKI